VDIDGDIVFLGYNDCARRVISKLSERRRQTGGSESVCVVSTRKIADVEWVDHVERDYTKRTAFEGIDWSEVAVAIIFHQIETGETPSEVDIKTVTTALRLPDHVRILAEIVDEDYADVMRADIPQTTDIVYKERLDANLIAHTIVNPGRASEMFQEMVDRREHRIQTFGLSEFVDSDETTVGALRRTLVDVDRVALLGLRKKGDEEVQLNPPLQASIEKDDVLFCLVSST
jgi:hypothetical protein